ncbi:MAG: DNA polymerase III subunit delta' [Pirellula sp.]|nr:DNA polymerase III subunit delta' [Pirellula sp.]
MWQSVQGHDAVVEQFRGTLAAGRLATTYLFVGPEGIGKRAFALQLAKALLCTASDPTQLEPCGRCESCVLAAAGNHPDVLLIKRQAGTKFLKVEQFIGPQERRNQEGLCHDISLRPMLGRRRVAIIDDADWFTPESANCLLKTLEEPPPGAVIILLGTSRSRQLLTIISRSQVIRFQPLPDDVLSSLILTAGIVDNAAAAEELAARSHGSLTLARQLADAALWQMRDRFAAQWLSGELDAPRLAREVDEFINAAGKEADARRQRFRQLLNLVAAKLSESLRQLAAEGRPADATLAAIDRCLEAEEQLDRNANQSTLLESWIDDLATCQVQAKVAAR